jgi:hypothetical protein
MRASAVVKRQSATTPRALRVSSQAATSRCNCSQQDSYRTNAQHIPTLIAACVDLGVPILMLGLAASASYAPSAEERALLMQSIIEGLDHTADDCQTLGVSIRLPGTLPT